MQLPVLIRRGWSAFRNSGRMMRDQSLFKMLVVIFFAAGLFLGLGAIFYEGFHFLKQMGGAGLMIIHRLFALFFFGLSIMLVFSSIVTSYATIYRSDEVPSLLTRPVSSGELVLYKYFESALLSSWAFFFMIVPFVGAYAIQEKLPVTFALWTFLYSVPFVLLCSAVGTIMCMVLVRWLPSGRSLGFLVAGLALLVIAEAWSMYISVPPNEDETALVLARLIPGMRISSHPLWPSWWVAEGIMAMGRGVWGRGLMLWGVVMANVLLLCMVIEALGRSVFHEGWLKSTSGASRTRTSSMDLKLVRWALGSIAPDARGLLLKDIRTFLRDPMQWSQAAVFFGLLALYFASLRNLHYHTLTPVWKNLIVFLNMFSVSAVICSLNSRFVYPQMSLEGHGFWIIGMSPMRLTRVLRAKFALACVAVTSVSMVLMFLSARMLNVDGLHLRIALLLAACICITVTALSMGLGAVFLDLRERNPSAIVSSFGGTLNLVLCMLFTFVVMIPFGALFHHQAMQTISEAWFNRALAIGLIVLLITTISTTMIPLKLAERSLERREY